MIDLIFNRDTQLVSIDKSHFFRKVQTALAEGYFLRKRRRDIRRAAARIGGFFEKDEEVALETSTEEHDAAETERASAGREEAHDAPQPETDADEEKKEKPHWFSDRLAAIDEWLGKKTRYALLKKLPIVENRIVFSTFQNTYTCNCRYIADELLNRLEKEATAEKPNHGNRDIKDMPYQLIFIVNRAVYANKDDYDIPDDIWLVSRGSIASFIALGTAKFWFDNALNCIWKDIPKKDGQIYINTWHGSLGIKRLGGDEHWLDIARRSQDSIDYFLTNSTFDEDVFRGSFWPRREATKEDETPHQVEFLRYGHPRNDIFYQPVKMAELKTKVYGHWNINPQVHTALYAPTFRDNKSDVSAIRIDCEKLKKTLEQRFGGEWRIIVKAHMHNRHNPELRQMFANLDDVIDASDYNDMQELLAAVDVGITDYSSWIFDFIATRRPGFIYARDIEQYINSRGFYYPLSETPFSIASSDEELCANILAFNEEDYAVRLQKFFDGKGYFEDGSASGKTADFVCDVIKASKQTAGKKN